MRRTTMILAALMFVAAVVFSLATGKPSGRQASPPSEVGVQAGDELEVFTLDELLALDKVSAERRAALLRYLHDQTEKTLAELRALSPAERERFDALWTASGASNAEQILNAHLLVTADALTRYKEKLDTGVIGSYATLRFVGAVKLTLRESRGEPLPGHTVDTIPVSGPQVTVRMLANPLELPREHLSELLERAIALCDDGLAAVKLADGQFRGPPERNGLLSQHFWETKRRSGRELRERLRFVDFADYRDWGDFVFGILMMRQQLARRLPPAPK